MTRFSCMVEIFWLQSERYVFWKGFSHEDILISPGFPDLQIALSDVFELTLQQPAGELTVAKEGPAHYKTG